MTKIEKLRRKRFKFYYWIKNADELKTPEWKVFELEKEWMRLTRELFDLENKNRYLGVI
jgi:hypothetical protein